ncbi:hypothetical protein BUALT_Bualt14G0101600 [Buddleja alternifolia]|uniref:Uncharacterized protein n=1 Tax=Buddleja alternifolia TaxID=168488 RepID=A0AAV6WTH9_9LAMI|nr:hypothetical protein BUALT_Bualt14G0101600 [Buddleja alternifolia]
MSKDEITAVLDSMIQGSPSESEPSIFKVHTLRSDARDNVYDPKILAIGPYHHKKSSLQNMEQYKCRYMKQLLWVNNEQSVDRYVIAAIKMQKRARECYAGPIDLDENEFIKMMILDGCFLIELFRYYHYQMLRLANGYDPIFEWGIRDQLRHDIMLVDNQLPFFVLNELFNMTNYSGVDLTFLILKFFHRLYLNLSLPNTIEGRHMQKTDHIVGLIHHNLRGNVGNQTCENWENISSVSELREVGIRFEKAEAEIIFENGQRIMNLMDIKFVNGVLKIPQLDILSRMESQFGNLIAYEQNLPRGRRRYVSDYMFVMHCLLKTSDDAKLLMSHEIIKIWLGDNKDVCDMFKRLGKNILPSPKFSYSQIFSHVNGWKATPQRKATPWRNYIKNHKKHTLMAAKRDWVTGISDA